MNVCRYIIIAILFFSIPAYSIDQICEGDNCVQIGQNRGTINLEGVVLQIGINKGVVNIYGDPANVKKISDYENKIRTLTKKITKNLKQNGKLKNQRLSDAETLRQSVTYANNLLTQLDQLENRLLKIDPQHVLAQEILSAKKAMDTKLIKKLLIKKQILDDHQSAETDYELAGFQKLDFEYSASILNYEKAANLESENSLYQREAGKLHTFLGHNKEALIYLKKALSIDLKVDKANIINIVTDLRYIGIAYEALGQYGVALKYYNSAITTLSEYPGTVDTNIIFPLLNDNCALMLHMGDYEKAIKAYLNLYKRVEDVYGKDSSESLDVLQSLGTAYLYSKRINKAIDVFEQILLLRKTTDNNWKNDIGVLSLCANLAGAYKEAKQYDKAIYFIDESVKIGTELFGATHPKVLLWRFNQGMIFSSKGSFEDAENSFLTLLDDATRENMKVDYFIAKIYGNLGSIQYSNKKDCSALKYSKMGYNFFINYKGDKPNLADNLLDNIKHIQKYLDSMNLLKDCNENIEQEQDNFQNAKEDTFFHIPLEEYEKGLKDQEKEIKQLFENFGSYEKELAQRKLDHIRGKLSNIKKSYEDYINGFRERITRLKSLSEQEKSDLLNQSEDQNKFAAEANYQRCIAEQNENEYYKAFFLCERSVQLAPNNLLYLNQAGILASKLSLYNTAIEYHTKALSKSRSNNIQGDEATELGNLGNIYYNLGQYEKAIEFFENALSSSAKVRDEIKVDWADVHNKLGLIFKERKEYDKALLHFEQSKMLNAKYLSEKDPKLAIDFYNIGSTYGSLGQHRKAIEYYEQSLELNIELTGENTAQVAMASNNLGTSWQLLGDCKLAIKNYEKALHINLQLYRESSEEVILGFNNLGWAYRCIGDYPKTIVYLEKAQKGVEMSYGLDHPYAKKARSYVEKVKLEYLNHGQNGGVPN